MLRQMARYGLRAVLVGLAVVAMFALAQSRTAYIAKMVPLSATPGGAAAGSLTPGTQVQVLSEKGAFSQIQLQGWSPQGGSTAIFAAPGERILLATFGDAGKVGRKVKGKGADASGSPWEQVQATVWVPKAALIANVDSLWKQASQLYGKRCSTCHALPATDKYTANQWPGTLRGMAQRAGLSKEDTELLVRYAQAHAKK